MVPAAGRGRRRARFSTGDHNVASGVRSIVDPTGLGVRKAADISILALLAVIGAVAAGAHALCAVEQVLAYLAAALQRAVHRLGARR